MVHHSNPNHFMQGKARVSSHLMPHISDSCFSGSHRFPLNHHHQHTSNVLAKDLAACRHSTVVCRFPYYSCLVQTDMHGCGAGSVPCRSSGSRRKCACLGRGSV